MNAPPRSGATVQRWAVSLMILVSALTLPLAAGADPLTLSVRGSVREEYNDNIFFDDEDIDDFITSLHAGLGLIYHAPRWSVSLGAGTQGQIFAQESRENSVSVNQALRLATSVRATERLTISVNERLTHVGDTLTEGEEETVTSDPDPDDGTSGRETNIIRRGSSFTNAFGISASYRIAPRWNGTVGYNNGFSDFEDPDVHDITHAVHGTLGFSYSPTLGFSATYAYRIFNLNTGTDTETHAITFGAGWNFAEHWSASGSAGVFINRPLETPANEEDRNGKADDVGPTFSLALARTFERVVIGAGASQRVTPSGGIAGVSITTSGYLRAAARLTEKLRGSVTFTATNFDTDAGEYLGLQAAAGLSYPLTDHISLGLHYRYRWRDSDRTVVIEDEEVINEGTVDGNSVLVLVRAEFPVWQGDL